MSIRNTSAKGAASDPGIPLQWRAVSRVTTGIRYSAIGQRCGYEVTTYHPDGHNRLTGDSAGRSGEVMNRPLPPFLTGTTTMRRGCLQGIIFSRHAYVPTIDRLRNLPHHFYRNIKTRPPHGLYMATSHRGPTQAHHRYAESKYSAPSKWSIRLSVDRTEIYLG